MVLAHGVAWGGIGGLTVFAYGNTPVSLVGRVHHNNRAHMTSRPGRPHIEHGEIPTVPAEATPAGFTAASGRWAEPGVSRRL